MNRGLACPVTCGLCDPSNDKIDKRTPTTKDSIQTGLPSRVFPDTLKPRYVLLTGSGSCQAYNVLCDPVPLYLLYQLHAFAFSRSALNPFGTKRLHNDPTFPFFTSSCRCTMHPAHSLSPLPFPPSSILLQIQHASRLSAESNCSKVCEYDRRLSGCACGCFRWWEFGLRLGARLVGGRVH
jgi:hypothetical protein